MSEFEVVHRQPHGTVWCPVCQQATRHELVWLLPAGASSHYAMDEQLRCLRCGAMSGSRA